MQVTHFLLVSSKYVELYPVLSFDAACKGSKLTIIKNTMKETAD